MGFTGVISPLEVELFHPTLEVQPPCFYRLVYESPCFFVRVYRIVQKEVYPLEKMVVTTCRAYLLVMVQKSQTTTRDGPKKNLVK